jgi:hypothetical protein
MAVGNDMLRVEWKEEGKGAANGNVYLNKPLAIDELIDGLYKFAQKCYNECVTRSRIIPDQGAGIKIRISEILSKTLL